MSNVGLLEKAKTQRSARFGIPDTALRSVARWRERLYQEWRLAFRKWPTNSSDSRLCEPYLRPGTED